MDVNEVALGAEAFADVDPFMQVSTMLTFLYIARRGLCNQKDIELELRVSNAVASR
ncbi:hypothetical protein M2320_004701, partial [Rhodoblastus acidophilus]|nr:hypothetical protein [Rhodoblastus acidophilus]